MVHGSDYNSVLKFPILIGDIGGTNARFAIVQDSFADAREFPILHTVDFPTFDEALQSIFDQTHIMPRSAVLAVAGPVNGNEVDMTNSSWVVQPPELLERFGLDDIIILNDFEAQALAVVALGEEHLEKIGGGTAETTGSRVIVGPGTGLGIAGLIHACRTWVPIPGEGGHVDLGPRNEREIKIFKQMKAEDHRISAEHILCGRGIMNLYHAILAVEGLKPMLHTPEEVTAAAIAETEKAAVETLDLFLTFLGRLAGDLALVFMSKGGVYLAGGVVQELLPQLKDGRMRAAFEDKNPHRELLGKMPIFVITHPQAAMIGLSAYARTPIRFGVETAGRRWRVR